MTAVKSSTLTIIYYQRELEKKQAGKPYDPLLNTLGMEALGLEAEPEVEALPIIAHSQPVKAPETANTAEVLREIAKETPNHEPKPSVFLFTANSTLGYGSDNKNAFKGNLESFSCSDSSTTVLSY